MALLYQEIMNVPGLTGTWKDRLKQYYKKLTGKDYGGTLSEGNYMLNEIKNKNYGEPVPAAPAAGGTDLATGYAQPGVTAGQNASATPQFEAAMPFYDAWGRLVPQATEAALSQINPELNRQYTGQYRDLSNGLASSGGDRFGRGLANYGDLRAATERERSGQLQDWLSQYQQGYKSIFYDPSREAWNSAITQGRAPDQSLKEIPTWGEVANKYEGLYGAGTATATPAGQITQPAINQPFTPVNPSQWRGFTPAQPQFPTLLSPDTSPPSNGNLIGTFIDGNGDVQNNYQYQPY